MELCVILPTPLSPIHFPYFSLSEFMLIYMPTDRPKKKKLKITKEEEAALVPVKQLGFLVQKQESKEDF